MASPAHDRETGYLRRICQPGVEYCARSFVYSCVSPENCKQTELTGSSPPAIPPVWKSETVTSWKVTRQKLRPD
jgi:hypothetical protein